DRIRGGDGGGTDARPNYGAPAAYALPTRPGPLLAGCGRAACTRTPHVAAAALALSLAGKHFGHPAKIDSREPMSQPDIQEKVVAIKLTSGGLRWRMVRHLPDSRDRS